MSQPTAPQSTTVSRSPASDTQSTPRLQTATVSDAQSIPHPQTATVTSTVSEHSASSAVTPSTADVTQTAIKSEIEEPDMPALEEISPTLDLGVTRVVSAVQLEDTSTVTMAEVEVLWARQLEEHGEVLSPAIPPVPDTPTLTPTVTSQEGQTKEKSAASSQGQTKEKNTAQTSHKTRTAVKKSTGYNRAPPPLRTDLLKSLCGIDVQQMLDQIKSRGC